MAFCILQETLCCSVWLIIIIIIFTYQCCDPRQGPSSSYIGPSTQLKCELAHLKIICNFRTATTDHSSKFKALLLGSLCLLRLQGNEASLGFCCLQTISRDSFGEITVFRCIDLLFHLFDLTLPKRVLMGVVKENKYTNRPLGASIFALEPIYLF